MNVANVYNNIPDGNVLRSKR